jgi:protease I
MSCSSLKSYLRNVGANWVDGTLVADGNIVSSRNPGDMPGSNREMIAMLAGEVERIRR